MRQSVYDAVSAPAPSETFDDATIASCADFCGEALGEGAYLLVDEQTVDPDTFVGTCKCYPSTNAWESEIILPTFMTFSKIVLCSGMKSLIIIRMCLLLYLT